MNDRDEYWFGFWARRYEDIPPEWDEEEELEDD